MKDKKYILDIIQNKFLLKIFLTSKNFKCYNIDTTSSFIGVSPVELLVFFLEGDDFIFKVSDYVVYKRDVCQICNVKKIGNRDYYVMHPIDDSNLTINVPVDNPFGYLRNVLSKKEALNLIDKISSIDVIDSADRVVENQYKNLLQSCNLEDLICIIKTSYLRNDERIKNGKKIGEIDDTYFKLAEKILYNELSISLGKSYDDTKKFIIESVSCEK